MNYYYADANGQPVGPLSLQEIRSLAASGQIAANPNVRAEGGLEWKPLSAIGAAPPPYSPPPAAASSVPGSAPAPSVPPLSAKLKSVKSTLLSDFVSKLLGAARRALSPGLIERVLGFARDFGHYVVLAGAALTLVYAIYAAIKFDSLTMLMTGIGLFVAITIAQFAAQSFLGAGDKLVANTPSRIATSAFLECFGLLALLAAFAFLFVGIRTAIALEIFAPFLTGLLLAVLWTFVGGLSLHPRQLNVDIGEGTAGEEAIGLLTFAMKAGLKLVPLFFFLVALLGCFVILASFTDSGAQYAGMVRGIPGIGLAGPAGFAGAATVIFACLIPMLGYLLFLILYLVFDLIRAILSVPPKLDALRR